MLVGELGCCRDEDGAGEHARRLVTELQALDVRVRLDDAVHIGFGRRATDWELKGVPIRIDIGPRDLKHGNVTLVRRDVGALSLPMADVAVRTPDLLEAIQQAMFDDALRFREAAVSNATSVDEAAEAASAGVARIPWATLGTDGERRLRAYGVSVRCLQREDGSVPNVDDEPGLVAIVARAY